MAHAPVITAQDKAQWKNQAEWVEQTIRKTGTTGITNVELNKLKEATYGSISRTIVSRISELRDKLYEDGEAVHTEPVDEKAKVWKYWIGPLTPEYIADHVKRRKPKLRSDKFASMTRLLRMVKQDAEILEGTITQSTQDAVVKMLKEIDDLELDK